jgi:hypothetical protein
MANQVFSMGDTCGPVADDHAHDQHGDNPYAVGAPLSTGFNNADFFEPGHKVRAADKSSNEYHGAIHQQQRINNYRREHAGLGAKNDLGHPQDAGPTRADAYAHANIETGGKPHKRGGQS